MTENNKSFSRNCVEMTRAIKDKLDAKFATMNRGEISQFLRRESLEFSKSIELLRMQKK